MLYGDNPSGGGGFRPKPPDFSKIKDKGKRFFRRGAGIIAVVIVLLIVVFNGVFVLNAGEEAVVTRFGQYVKTIQSPGLQLIVPFVDKAEAVNVEGIRRLEFGFRSGTQTYLNTVSNVTEEAVGDESLMLTGDQNLVDADWAILYRIKNSYDYLYKVQDTEGTLRIISESAYRRVVASHPLDDVLTDKKDLMQREVMEDLQAICDKYTIGVQITAVQLQDAMPPDEVRAAFLDVSSAKEERQAKINEARKYESEQMPMARGTAAKLVNDAEGYKQKRINEAEGAVARYNAIELEYAAQPSIMRTRLYQEMIREVLPKVSHIYFVDEGGETVRFLPLDGATVIPKQPEGGTGR